MAETAIETKRFRGSIGRTLISYFILLAVLPLVLVVAIVINQANSQAREQAANQMASVSEVKTNEIIRLLESGEGILRLTLADPRQLPRIVQSVESEDPRLAPIQQVTEYLNEKLVVQTTFSEMFVYNPAGEVRASTTEANVGTLVNELSFFDTSMDGLTTHQPYYDPETNALNIIVSSPLYSEESGEIIGVLAGRLNVEELSNIMTTRVGLGDTGETYLVSRANNFLVTPSRFEGYPLTQEYRSLGIDRGLKSVEDTDVYDSYRGEKVIGFYRYIPELESAMLAEISENEALATLRDVRNLSILAAALAGLLALLIGSGVTYWLTRPITALTRVATALTSGDYQQQVPVTRQNEIGQLADSFNTMTSKLIDTIAATNQANNELKVATEQAQAALRVKDEFLAVMSHELRTPLNAIIGFTGIMTMDGRLPERDLMMTQRIEANSQRLLALINDVLDISKIEAGQLEIVPLPISLHEMVRRMEAQMSILAERKGVKLVMEVKASIPKTILMDEDAITKITTNLLANAIKFTDEGKVTLAMFADDGNLILEVSDTGVGIPTHMHDVIFDSFRQGDSTSTRKYGGTGLGLAITRRLVTAMNGTIRVNSTVGQGSTFTVTLPLETTEQKQMEL